MNGDNNYIYTEDQWRLLEGPFVVETHKWPRSIKKRVRRLRRLISRPRGRMRERIVEIPLTLAAISQLAPGSKVADIGGASSIMALELAYLGHKVEVIDLRDCPLKHPSVCVKRMDLFDNGLPDDCFDAITCISVIEHVGIDRYGGSSRVDGDLAMISEFGRLCRPGGTVVLSGPYGRGHNPVKDGPPHGYRVYDRKRLERLLDGFTVEQLRFFVIEKGIWLEKPQEQADMVATTRPVNGIFFAKLTLTADK